MTQRRKDALKILVISIPMLIYGALTFEIGGTASSAEAIAKSIVTTLGLFGTVIGLLMFFTKNSLGLVDSQKPEQIIKKEKKMPKTKEEKPVKKSGSESIELMQREKELVKRADELNALVNEVETELNRVRENLETKGWVNSGNGWVIE
jgi:hypothetical protein